MTDALPRSPDLLIFGRGIAGLSIAFRAALAGLEVVVIGKNYGTASQAALGISSLKGLVLPASPLFSAKLQGHRNLGKWFEEIGDESKQSLKWSNWPVVEPFWDAFSFEKIRKRVYRYGFRGTSATKIINREEAQLLGLNVEFLSKTIQGLFVYSDALWFDPGAVLAGLEKAIQRLGVRCLNAEVEDLSFGRSELLFSLKDQNSRVQMKPKAIALACGASSTDFLGVLGFSAPKIDRVWGETAETHSNTGKSFGCLDELYGFRMTGGIIRIGSSSHVIRSNEDTENPSSFIREKTNELVSKFVDNMGLSCVICGDKKWSYTGGERIRVKDRGPLVDIFEKPWDPDDQKSGILKIAVVTAYYKAGYQLANPLACYVLSQLFPEREIQSSLNKNDLRWFSCLRS